MAVWTVYVWITVISMFGDTGLAHPLMNATCHGNETWIPIPKEHWPHFNLVGMCRNVTPDMYIPCGTYDRWVPIPKTMTKNIDFDKLCDTTVKANESLYRSSQVTSRVPVLPTSVRCTPYPAELVISLIILLILSLMLNAAFVIMTIYLAR